MTIREFYVNVLDLIDVIESDDPTGCVDTKVMGDKARELIAALDARNEKRKGTESKEKQAARARRESVLNFLIENKGESFTRDQIAEAVGISGAAVSSACKALGDAVCKAEVKIDKARRVVYTLAE